MTCPPLCTTQIISEFILLRLPGGVADRAYGQGFVDRSSDSLLLTQPDASTIQGKIRWNYDNIRRSTATRYPASIASGDSAIYAYDAMGNRILIILKLIVIR